jgi:drug/metabolite transporter (DMT)-like permease
MPTSDATTATAPVARALPAHPVSVTDRRAKGLLLLAALGWGMGNVSQKTILEHMDAFTANGITCLVGAAILCPFAWREARRDLPSSRGSLPLLLLLAGVFSIAATLFQLGFGHTTVTNAGFLVNTAAVLTPILAWVLYRQSSHILIWPAGFCALSGIFLMGGGRLTTLVLGDLLALGAALAYAVWTLLVSRYVVRYRRPLFLTAFQLFVCGSACICIGAAIHGLPPLAAVAAALPEILLIGCVSKGLAYALTARAQQRVTPSCAAILVSAESVFGAALAMMFLAEAPGLIRFTGAGLIVLGVVLASYAPAMVAKDLRSV